MEYYKMFKFLIGVLLCGLVYAKPNAIVLTDANSVSFNEAVTEGYVSQKILEVISKASKTDRLFLVLNTPGGSVSSGLKFVDVIKGLDVKVDTITIFAASMGYQFVQELGRRYILKSGILMSHRGSVSGIGGQLPGELNSRINLITQLLNRMSEVASKRVGLSKERYEESITHELWLTGNNAVKERHADEVVNVTCDQTLASKTQTKTFFTIFGNVDVTFSLCPLITAPISVKFKPGVKKENYSKIHKILNQKFKKSYFNF